MSSVEKCSGALADVASAPAGQARSGGWLLGATLVLAAFNLRLAVTSLGPVFSDATRATGMSGVAASLLTTVPSLCFGLFGPLAPYLARRLGAQRALLAMLVLVAAGTALRGVPAVASLFAGQTLACMGIGVMNVLLPSLIKREFAGHVAVVTGLCTMAFCVGAAAAAAVTAPIQEFLHGSWSLALAAWSLPTLLAAGAWVLQLRRRASVPADAATAVRGLLRDPLAWQITLFMGMQSSLAYIVFGWMVPMLRERGLDPVKAGLVLSVSVLAQAVSSLVAPYLATRGKDQRFANGLAAVLTIAGLLGCFYAPLSGIWFWTVLLGLAQGATIALALTQIALRSADARIAAHLSSMAQGFGYLIASAGPLLAGLLHEWTGGWDAVAVLCVGFSCILLPSGIGAGRNAHVGAVLVPRLP